MKTIFFFLPFSALVLLSSLSFKKGPDALHVKHGDSLELKSYKGKILVLNFWASWSKVSRGENKNLSRVYNVFKSNPKIVFASVSLDMEEKQWKLAIEEDELVWKDQFCDFKKYQSPMALRYGVNTLPRFFVYDAGGKQIYSSTNSHDLESVIKAQLK